MSYPVALLVVGPLLIFSPAFVCALVVYLFIKKEEKMQLTSHVSYLLDEISKVANHMKCKGCDLSKIKITCERDGREKGDVRRD